jgi:hypothetical protein
MMEVMCDGNTLETHGELLEPLGLKIQESVGIESRALSALDRPIRALSNSAGDVAAVPPFVLAYPLMLLYLATAAQSRLVGV